MLPIAIACTTPPLIPRPRWEWIRPVSLLLAAGTIGVMVMGLAVGPRMHCGFPESKVDIAKLTVTKYATEAYPAWRSEYRCSKCPLELWQLSDFIDKTDTRDPWGREYQFTCGDAGFFAMSLGEDGVSNTPDDIWSHQ